MRTRIVYCECGQEIEVEETDYHTRRCLGCVLRNERDGRRKGRYDPYADEQE